MTPQEHYEAAEAALDEYTQWRADRASSSRQVPITLEAEAHAANRLAVAQIHATLATVDLGALR
jgi:hypothetical protein